MSQLNSNILNQILQMISGCHFKEKYHLYCPGCGGTRAIIELLNGQFLKSLYYNPLPLYLLMDGVLMFFTILLEILQYKKRKYLKIRITSKIIFLLLAVGVFFLRNYLLVIEKIDVLGDFL